ncbi:MAG: hypothetical protein CMF62_04140 [Magnetococcales bacterium]|nr:hypothetical protein [Magnetococcales bacterium]|tara:strand:+ start:20992 stop:23877 length:2886 start_codon:yes stop_codon:yes gene_type:complete
MSQQIDQSLYSRQLYTIGFEAMQKISGSKILLIGLNGLGVEVAKNLILTGVNQVTLCDDNPINIDDLGSDYYVTENDIGKIRSITLQPILAELNPYVTVNIHQGDITEEILSKYHVVVSLNSLLSEQIKLNQFTHENNIKFISGDSRGLFGSVFTDFGKEFVVTDSNGEELKSSIIAKISDTGIVECVESQPHDLGTGDYVQFNTDETIYEIKVHSPHTFSLCNFEKSFGAESFKQVKLPTTHNFQSLEDAIKNPEYVISDFAHMERPNTLHICYQGLDLYYNKYQTLPTPENTDTFIDLINKISSDYEKDIVMKFCSMCQTNLVPVNSVIGGIVAQEVQKACTGKYTPIKQFFYFDSLDSLSNDIINKSEIKDRYLSTRQVFGDSFVSKLKNQKYFVVGSGAIGCELLKNFAMMGLGNMVVTDMDTIEKSNLNRQFLFRSTDIGKLKSVAACDAIKRMNPDIKVESHENRVGCETENVYNSKFFDSIDGVTNALDNKQARLYMDSRCVFFNKPLLESGTLGTKGNVQVIIPHLTENYGAKQDPPEKTIPMCTLKHFPNKIEHCVQYARDQFEGLFTNAPNNANQYMKNSKFIEELPKGEVSQTIEDIVKILKDELPKTYDNCLELGYLYFYRYYRDQIQQLLQKYPKDHKTDTGALFWSGEKKCPTPLDFDITNETHTMFVYSFANLWAEIYNIEKEDYEVTKQKLESFSPPSPQMDFDKDIENLDKKEEKEEEKEDKDIINLDILDGLSHTEIISHEFEKDSDTNFHMDFVTCASNLRAMNYSIETADKHRTRGIAGKIIPAIATTTAIVAGLVALELYKVVNGEKNIEKYRDTCFNLAIPFFAFTEPVKCQSYETLGKKYTQWDHYETNDMKLGEFLDNFEENTGLEIDMMTYGSQMIYSFMLSQTKQDERRQLTIRENIERLSENKLTGDAIALSLSVIDPDDEDNEIEFPEVKLLI